MSGRRGPLRRSNLASCHEAGSHAMPPESCSDLGVLLSRSRLTVGVTRRFWKRSSGAAAVLWQQLECLSMTWPYYGEMAPVECGDPDRAMPLGQGDHGRIRPAEPQVSVGADQILDALPVGYVEIGHFQLAIDDGRVQAGFRLRAKLPVDQVGGLRDDHSCGDQGTLVALQQLPAGLVVLI